MKSQKVDFTINSSSEKGLWRGTCNLTLFVALDGYLVSLSIRPKFANENLCSMSLMRPLEWGAKL